MHKKANWALFSIFMIVICIIILLGFSKFSASLFESGPEYTALSAMHRAIDEVCEYHSGESTQFGPQFAPYYSTSAKRKAFYYKIEKHDDKPHIVLKYSRDVWGFTKRETLKKLPLDTCAENGIAVVNKNQDDDFKFDRSSNTEYITLSLSRERSDLIVEWEWD